MAYQQQPQQQRQQGVLWKRRDVFKTKWRPRWFVLQPEEAVLTYYLLSRSDAAATSTISTPLRRSNAGGNTTNNNFNNINVHSNGVGTYTAPAPPTTALVARSSIGNPSIHSGVSDVTTDIMSTAGATVSENPVDYDVVPRGAIYLAGCQVSINDTLSRPEEGLFAFTIAPPNADETPCHLAARTEEARAAWVAKLSAAASREDASSDDDNDNNDDNNDNNNIDRINATTSPAAENAVNGDSSNHNNGYRASSSSTTSSSTWKSLSPPETLFDNVPAALAAKIEQSLESHLELCENDAPALHWTPIFQDRDGVSAFQRQDLHGRTIMKSTAIIPHHPKQIINLLLNSARRPDFEANVENSERLDVLNPFTFLDYYAYKAVWPTSPRDFAVVLHWQALQRQHSRHASLEGRREEALVTLAFSCKQADDLKEPTLPHVRANLHSSFYLLRLIPAGTGSDTSPKCHLTRILSYDLGGSLPRNLTATVLMQQAGMPGILSKFLKREEPSPDPRLTTNDGPLTNELVIKDVVEAILEKNDTALVSSARRRLNFDKTAQEQVAGMASSESTELDDNDDDDDDKTTGAKRATQGGFSELPVPYVTVVLLGPVLLHRLAIYAGLSIVSDMFGFWFLHPAVVFCLSAFFAVRYVIIRSLGKEIIKPQAFWGNIRGPTTLYFVVDLKGVLRFIGMKREEKKELPTSQQSSPASPPSPKATEVSVVHIVAIALAKAMQNHTDCWNYQRVQIPWLFIDGLYRYPRRSRLDLSISMTSGKVITLKNFRYENVQAVANATEELLRDHNNQPTGSSWMNIVTSCLKNLLEGHPRHGRCLIVLATKTDSEDDNQTNCSSDAAGVEITQCHLPQDLDALVVVGGVRLHRTTSSSLGSPHRTAPPKPILSLSLVVNTANVLDTAKCHAFAEDLQKLIQFPELCDD